MTDGERVKYVREMRGITQKELAKRLETTQGRISAIETSAWGGLSVPTVRKLCKALKTDPNTLIGGWGKDE